MWPGRYNLTSHLASSAAARVMEQHSVISVTSTRQTWHMARDTQGSTGHTHDSDPSNNWCSVCYLLWHITPLRFDSFFMCLLIPRLSLEGHILRASCIISSLLKNVEERYSCRMIGLQFAHRQL